MKKGLQLQISRQEAVLIFITMLWGATFLIIHHAMEVAGPFFFFGMRFTVAALLLIVIFRRQLLGINRYEILAGLSIGLTLAVGYGFQTWGLQTISSSQSAFMTAMYVPLVPLLQWLFFRRPPGLMSWCGVVLAVIGLLLLSDTHNTEVNHLGIGEIVTLLSTFAIAGEIILISGFAARVNARRVTVLQLLAGALFSFLFMISAQEPISAMTSTFWWSAGGLGAMSAAIQLTMNWAQRSLSPTRATVIYAGEPVWGGYSGA